VLYKIVKATIEAFGVEMGDFASRTTDSGLLAKMAKTIRLTLRDAFVSSHCGRVWEPNTPDPSIFRDASIALLPSFAMKPILEFMKLQTGLDERALPPNTCVHIPTTDDEVQEKPQSVWQEVRDRKC